jgi:hypothetical protein
MLLQNNASTYPGGPSRAEPHISVETTYSGKPLGWGKSPLRSAGHLESS